MALSNADKQRAYRRRKAEARLRYQNVTVVEEIQQLRDEVTLRLRYQNVTVVEEIQQLRDEVTLLKALLRARAFKNLPSEDKLSEKEGSKKERESEQARLARLEAWTPNDTCRKRAYDEAHDDAWLDRQAEMYRCQQANAKLKHKNFDRGFLKWILNAPAFEDRPNGQANGHGRQQELSPAGKLYLGASGAAAEVLRREFQQKQRDEAERDSRGGRSSSRSLLDG